MKTKMLVAKFEDKGTSTLSSGMALMIIAMLIIPGIDAIAKLLSDSIAAGQVAWARFFFQVILLAPFLGRYGLKLDRMLWMHAARGGLIALSTLIFFTALKTMPLANAIAIFFVQPFIVTLLAYAILGETFGWRRMLAIIFGFVGALLIIKPSYEAFGLITLLPVATAFLFALYAILTRWLLVNASDISASPVSMQFLAGFFGMMTMSVALVLGYVHEISFLTPTWPTAAQWQLLALLGIIGTSAHFLVVMAYARVSIAVLAPFQYLEIVGATVLGLMLFNEFPDLLTWLGIAIIVSSGIFVFFRERKLARR